MTGRVVFRSRVLTYTEMHQSSSHQELSATTMYLRVSPQIAVFDLRLGGM
jgi:hypothetical protein